MFCGGCGKGLAHDERFCAQCGGQAQAPQQSTLNGQQMPPNNTMGGGMGHQPMGQPGMTANDMTMMHGGHQQPQQNGLAIGGFICALIGLLIFPLEIIGLVLSIIGLVRAPKMGGKGRGLAIAGIIIAVVGIVILIISIAQGSMFVW